MNNFTIIGIDDKDHPELPEQAHGRPSPPITFFPGGKRHHEIMRDNLPEPHLWIDITVPLDDVFRQYENHPDIVVFASGDPLFFGFANTVLKRLPDAKITLIPTFNSLQTLAHRLLLPYHDMHVVSLTGRPWHEFDRALIEGQEKIGVLTDREHTPATIAERMLRYGYDNYIIYVGEALGSDTETIRVLVPDDAKALTFRHPNCLDSLPHVRAAAAFRHSRKRFRTARRTCQHDHESSDPPAHAGTTGPSSLSNPVGHRVLHGLRLHRGETPVPSPARRGFRATP